jgi:hypothetical protein
LIIHGFWPVGGIARRMLEKTIPSICFVPLPLTECFLDTIQDARTDETLLDSSVQAEKQNHPFDSQSNQIASAVAQAQLYLQGRAKTGLAERAADQYIQHAAAGFIIGQRFI